MDLNKDEDWTVTVNYVGGYSLVTKHVRFYRIGDAILKASKIGQECEDLGPIDTIEVA